MPPEKLAIHCTNWEGRFYGDNMLCISVLRGVGYTPRQISCPLASMQSTRLGCRDGWREIECLCTKLISE